MTLTPTGTPRTQDKSGLMEAAAASLAPGGWFVATLFCKAASPPHEELSPDQEARWRELSDEYYKLVHASTIANVSASECVCVCDFRVTPSQLYGCLTRVCVHA